MQVVLHILCMLTWPWPDPRSRSRLLTFWTSENCTFLRLSPPLFWRHCHKWWVIMIVWHLVYSFSEPDLWISPPAGGQVTLKFTKCWHHQNSLRFIFTLTEDRRLWLWLQVSRKKPCMLAAMTVSPLAGLFYLHLYLLFYYQFWVSYLVILHVYTANFFWKINTRHQVRKPVNEWDYWHVCEFPCKGQK